MLGAGLAKLYGATTKHLNERVKRSRGRLPDDFMFVLRKEETESLRSQFAASSSWSRRRCNPLPLTRRVAATGSFSRRGLFHQVRPLLLSSVSLPRRRGFMKDRAGRGPFFSFMHGCRDEQVAQTSRISKSAVLFSKGIAAEILRGETLPYPAYCVLRRPFLAGGMRGAVSFS